MIGFSGGSVVKNHPVSAASPVSLADAAARGGGRSRGPRGRERG